MSEEDAEKNVCSICLENFRCPKLLPCRHTFCKRCIRSHQKRAADKELSFLRCPICRASLNVPEEGIRGFCDNFFVSGVHPDSICDDCSAEDDVVECSKCDAYLCQDCQYTHKCKTKEKRFSRERWLMRPFSLDEDIWSDSDSDYEETNSISSDESDSFSSVPWELRDIGCKTIYKAVQEFSIDTDLDTPVVSSLLPISSEEMGAVYFAVNYIHRFRMDGTSCPPREVLESTIDISFGPNNEMLSAVSGYEGIIKLQNEETSFLPVASCSTLKVVALSDGRTIVVGKENIGPLMVVILDKHGEEVRRMKTKLTTDPISVAASAKSETLCITLDKTPEVYFLDFNGKSSNVYNLRQLYEDASDDFRPLGVCCDNSGDFLLVEGASNTIHIVSPSGRLIGMIAGEEFEYPYAISVDSKNRIWLGDREDGRIRVFSVEGFVNVFDHPNNIQREMGILPMSSASIRRNRRRYGRHVVFP